MAAAVGSRKGSRHDGANLKANLADWSSEAQVASYLEKIITMAGRCAHRIEEVLIGGRIIRPAYKNVSEPVGCLPMAER